LNFSDDAWPQLIYDTLRALGGQENFVPAAKLKTQIEILGNRRGLSLKDRRSGMPFGVFLETIPGIEVHRQQIGDILVGFPTTPPPTPGLTGGRRTGTGFHVFRKDVYEALTRVIVGGFVYDPGKDVFKPRDGSDDELIALPLVTFETLRQVRQRFIHEIGVPDQSVALGEALRSSNPLGNFQKVLVEKGLTAMWHEFHYRTLKSTLESWATENGLPVKPEWFAPAIGRDTGTSAQEAFSNLLKFMTPDEIRSLSIPFRAVEAMYLSLQGQ
jgi:hypothetical protein